MDKKNIYGLTSYKVLKQRYNYLSSCPEKLEMLKNNLTLCETFLHKWAEDGDHEIISFIEKINHYLLKICDRKHI